MAFQISVSGTSSVLNLEYYDGIKLNGPYEICLKSFVTYNNIPNITSNNNELIFIDDKVPKQYVIILPTGTYELHDLISWLEQNATYQQSNTFMRLNKNTFKVEITSNWHIDFTSKNSVGPTLGFSTNVFPPNITNHSDLPVQLFSVNTLKIKCNLIKCNVDNLRQNDNTLHEFPLKGEGGEKIVERPISLCYYPINTDNIFQLHLTIVDQDNNIVDFRGEKISMVLGFQPLKV